ncbi:MAG: hypothetical protein FWD60_10775 [Candidatus Azobacteroides sp.]|nr:hypothetical protein [Candidatus Azobacteroides sp.]
MKKIVQFFSLIALVAITSLASCNENTLSKPNDNPGVVPDSIIPRDIRGKLDSLMPIYSGTTPPDISGEFLANDPVLIGSNLESDSSGIGQNGIWADLYFAFTKSNGKYVYQEKNATASGSGNDVTVTVTVVGTNKNFTAYFIDNTSDPNFTSKQSTVISGTMSSDGISDFYYAFIMLEKNDPNNVAVPVNTYRVFKEDDGLAENYNWTDITSTVISKSFSNEFNKSLKGTPDKKGVYMNINK